MGLFAEGIPLILDEVKRNNGRVVHLGRKDRISRLFPEVRAVLDTAEIETATNTGQVVCLGIDYGAQDQELRAMQKLLALKLPKGTPITPELLKRLSDTHLKDGTDIPPIDLIFRPGGDQRTSGLPNAEYAEFYSIIPPLPATTALDYVLGLVNYSKRPRSFGGDCAVK
jgi:undecaprenyl diphosphate synthase